MLSDRIEEIRAAVGRCSRPERDTSEGHRRELLAEVDRLRDGRQPDTEPRLPAEHEMLLALRTKAAHAVTLDVLRNEVLLTIDCAVARIERDAACIARRHDEVVRLAVANGELAHLVVGIMADRDEAST